MSAKFLTILQIYTYLLKMGGKESKTDINSSGQVNNNVIVQQHIEMWREGRILVYVLIVLRVFEILYVLYKDFYHGLKKKAARNNNNQA